MSAAALLATVSSCTATAAQAQTPVHPLPALSAVYRTTEPSEPAEASVRNFMGEKSARFFSHSGNLGYLALGIGLPYLEERGSRLGRERSLRTLDAVLTATVLCEGLKALAREERPDHSDHKSFPSGHATAAFAVAAMESHYHPDQAPLWYAGATLIAASRVRLRRHYTQDVIAGAVLGITTAEVERRQRRGLLLAPVITPTLSDGGGMRVSIGGSF